MIKSSKDNRYATDSVVTHDGTKFPCWPLTDLLSFKEKFGSQAYEQVIEILLGCCSNCWLIRFLIDLLI